VAVPPKLVDLNGSISTGRSRRLAINVRPWF
jgi:hypothetical protein